MILKTKKKIFFLSGKRGGFDAMLPLSNLLLKNSNIKYKIILTDQHLQSKFGSTHLLYEKIIKRNNLYKINTHQLNSTAKERLFSFSKLLNELTKILHKDRPDLMLLYGDRCESLIAAIACLNLNIPICHFQGGDVTGNIDEKLRHSITKISDIHFCSNIQSKKRLLQLGESKKMVFNIGDSHIDALKKIKISRKILTTEFNIRHKEDYCVLLFHPEGTSFLRNKQYINTILEVLKNLKIVVFCVYPCTDIGYETIIESLNSIEKKNKFFRVFKNISHKYFINLLKFSRFLIGNSSSGIIESPYLKVPTINLGTRQLNRLTTVNILNSKINKLDILKKIKIINSKQFKKNMINVKLHYGNGRSYLKAYKIIIKKIDKINTSKNFNDKK
jgi:UDP-N-acetylglucosamine 2-epimerase (hydrolysing)